MVPDRRLECGRFAKPWRSLDGRQGARTSVQQRLALVLSVATGGLAIAAVAVDLAYGLEASLETRDGDGWRTVSATADQSYASSPFAASCASTDLRLVVHNDRLVASSVDVLVSYYDNRGGDVVVLRETWSLERGETRVHGFTVPASAFDGQSGTVKPMVSVNAQVDDQYLGTCVQEAT